jgi:hypothetical protein
VRREDVDRVEWVQPLVFSDFRSEWLPGRAEDTKISIEGASFVAREEQRALFPARAGVFEIPSRGSDGRGAALRCTSSVQSDIVEVPSVHVRVVEPPAQGRPPGFSGVVGPIQVQTVADRAELRLGEAVGVSILVRGAANLWDLDPPITAGDFEAGEEFFPRLPELDVVPGDHLYVRRFFRFNLVPHGVGRLVIPEVRVPYYDPRSGRYAEARAAAIEIEVEPRAQSVTGAYARPRRYGPTADLPALARTPPSSRARTWTLWLGALSFALVCGLASTFARKRWRRSRPLRVALALADGAAREQDARGEAAGLAQALRAALALAAPGLEDLDTTLIRARAPAEPALAEAIATAAAQLAALEEVRFSEHDGPSREAERPRRDQVIATLASLRAGRRSWALLSGV